MTPHAHWTADSGTTELPSLPRGVPVEHLPTAEVPFWHPRPSVPTRHARWSWADVWRHLLTGVRRLASFLLLVAFLIALSAQPAQAGPGGPAEFEPRYEGPGYGANAAVSVVREFFQGFWDVTR